MPHPTPKVNDRDYNDNLLFCPQPRALIESVET